MTTADQAGEKLATMLQDRADQPIVHKDGIYFGLDKQEYHDDPALGSGDMKKLAYAPPDYWFGSWMNPNRPPDTSTEAQMTGTAVHVLVLEGEAAFDARYMRGPDQGGMTPAEKGQSTKKANERAGQLGKECLRAADYDRIAIASAMIMRNPKLATAFVGGAAEVSIFWTELHGSASVPIRKKARLDYLKPRGVGDLKKVANQHEVPFPRACINAITNYNYHVQTKHYLDARARLPALIEAKAINGDYDPTLLKGIVEAKRWAWQFIFWQGERAPITHSLVISPGNPILELAGAVTARADANYIAYLEKFGTLMWLDEAEPKELFIEELPPWFARD